ncbi:unnamed protein product, partial [Prorocentrum cordatum]
AEEFASLSGEEAQQRARELKGQEDSTFGGFGSKWNAMHAVLRAKFAPGSALHAALLLTGDAFLLNHEVASGLDEVWSDNFDGEGQNQLGILLMLVRDELGGTYKWTQFIADLFDLDAGRPKSSAAADKWQHAVRDACASLSREVDRTRGLPAARPHAAFRHQPPSPAPPASEEALLRTSGRSPLPQPSAPHAPSAEWCLGSMSDVPDTPRVPPPAEMRRVIIRGMELRDVLLEPPLASHVQDVREFEDVPEAPPPPNLMTRSLLRVPSDEVPGSPEDARRPGRRAPPLPVPPPSWSLHLDILQPGGGAWPRGPASSLIHQGLEFSSARTSLSPSAAAEARTVTRL